MTFSHYPSPNPHRMSHLCASNIDSRGEGVYQFIHRLSFGSRPFGSRGVPSGST